MTTTKRALVIGANRGLGLGLVQQLNQEGWQVAATTRGESPVALKQAASTLYALEMNDLGSIEALAGQLAGQRFDLVFVNAGVMGPTRDLDAATAEDIGQLFTTNVLSPIRLAQRLVSLVQENTGVLAFMSSTLGTVASPDAPEIPLYKASKAALNSMVNTFASTLPQPRPTILCMHPGWVRTDMGGPNAEIDVVTSAQGMVRQVNEFAGRGGLHFIDYRGRQLPW
ncbi:SDR family oxidoreductase [Pseudomonas massiliensis]|uniref:SDR family oxidoreductase n=1 Tax=Pseudomonas massiliensis TaxID=522492 RepID=UPI0005903850|nr:SDR family oxidoreductase [Pseudomonas massiliensis]